MTTTARQTIEETISIAAVQQENGQWTIDGKDTHSWYGEAMRLQACGMKDKSFSALAMACTTFRVASQLALMDTTTSI